MFMVLKISDPTLNIANEYQISAKTWDAPCNHHKSWNMSYIKPTNSTMLLECLQVTNIYIYLLIKNPVISFWSRNSMNKIYISATKREYSLEEDILDHKQNICFSKLHTWKINGDF